MFGISMAKERAAVPMIAGIVGTFYFENEHKVRKLNVSNECDVVRTSHFGLIVASAFVESVGLVCPLFVDQPILMDRRLPFSIYALKIVAENQWQTIRFQYGFQ